MKFLQLAAAALLLVSCKSDRKQPELPAQTKIAFEGPLVMPLEAPSGFDSSLPRLFAAEDKLYMSWVEKSDTVAKLFFASMEDRTWSKPEMIIAGSDWFVNWADFPAIAAKDDKILTNFLQKSATGTYTYDVKLNLFSEAIGGWKKNFILHNDGTKSEHGFVSIVPTDEEDFFLTWLDGRDTVGKEHGQGQMTLRGAFVNFDGSITGDTLLDSRICDCCQTAAAMTLQGPIVAYRDRTDDEIRDISVVRGVDGLWTAPVTIGADNWKIAGCPVNGPSMDAWDTTVGLAWFTAANDTPKVQVAFSEDDGANFGMPIRIDAGGAIGRVDIVMLDSDRAAVLWMESQNEDTLVQLMFVTKEGTTNSPITIAKTSPERASGFPQMELSGNVLYIAWTSIEGEREEINMTGVIVEDI